MKPTQADIDWCLANRELVMRWLKRRGEWQAGDWFYDGLVGGIGLLRFGDSSTYELDTWLLTIDDAIEMLVARGVTPELLSLKLESSIAGSVVVWFATDGVIMVPVPQECHRTPCIALMELLKSLEGKHEREL